VVLEVFEYRVAVAAGPFGEQGLANLDKLLVLASAREARGAGVSAFARELLELADDAPKEAQGEVVDELDLEAVTLCTVHQAKGLEWPIVVLPDLPTQPRNENAAVRFDRSLGLSLVRPKGTSDLRSLSATHISNQLSKRARAENLRLLYVAMTRARDRLVLGLRPHNSPNHTWANDLNAFFALKVSGDQPERLDVSKLATRKPESVSAAPGSREDVARLIAHVRAPRESTTTSMVLPVTQLQDLVSCPRRFHFAHQVGLSERPVSFEWRDEESGDDDVRVRGTAAHKLLELTPLASVGILGLSAVLRELRRAAGLERVAGDDVMAWVERFWASDFGRSLGGATVHRELPFALRLPSADGPTLVLRGQIDLLVVHEGEVLVIDYKTSTMPTAGLEPYRFQLGCYALAAQRFVGASLPIRAGIVFLRDESPEPHFLPDLHGDELAALLARESAGLAQAQRTGVWPSRPRERCEALGCGYVYRCHP
jgi:ATP-dependent helicase/nuclease subunit A